MVNKDSHHKWLIQDEPPLLLKFEVLKFSEFSAGQLHIVCELHVNYTILYMKVPSFKILAP